LLATAIRLWTADVEHPDQAQRSSAEPSLACEGGEALAEPFGSSNLPVPTIAPLAAGAALGVAFLLLAVLQNSHPGAARKRGARVGTVRMRDGLDPSGMALGLAPPARSRFDWQR